MVQNYTIKLKNPSAVPKRILLHGIILVYQELTDEE